jgi:hypothetical protein
VSREHQKGISSGRTKYETNVDTDLKCSEFISFSIVKRFSESPPSGSECSRGKRGSGR